MRWMVPVLCLLAVGCAESRQPIATPVGFGDAVRHNMAQHIIDPVGADPSVPIPADGQRAALSIERYRADEVETPATTAISDVAPTEDAGEGAPAGGSD